MEQSCRRVHALLIHLRMSALHIGHHEPAVYETIRAERAAPQTPFQDPKSPDAGLRALRCACVAPGCVADPVDYADRYTERDQYWDRDPLRPMPLQRLSTLLERLCVESSMTDTG